MRVVGEFNKLSKAIIDKIITLKPGEFADYQLASNLQLTVEDPVTEKKQKWYPHQQLYAKATIWDEHKEGGPGTVDIGVIEEVDPQTKLVTRCTAFEFERSPSGVLRLSGDRPKDVELDQFLQLDNRTENSVLGEHRDASVQILYRRVDQDKEALKRSDKRKMKTEAMRLAGLMNHEELKEFGASLNWDTRGKASELSDRVGEFAEDHYELFDDIIKNMDKMKVRAAIRFAIDDGKIKFDAVKYQFLWSHGGLIASLTRQDKKNELEVFAEWLQTSQNGPNVLNQLRRPKKAAATA